MGDRWKEAGCILVLLAVFLLIYALLMQAPPTLDGVIYLYQAWARPRQFNHYHMLYVPLLSVAMDLGGWVGNFRAQTSGTMLSAAFMAVAAGLFYLLLRRAGIGVGLALIFALLFGLANPALENATTVEIYAPAMAAVLLTLHAFWREMEHPAARHAMALLGACALVALIHVGFCPWVLALYLSLSWVHRRRPRQALGYLLHGAAVLVILLLAIALAGPSARATGNQYAWMFGEYFNRMPPWRMLYRLLAAPMSDVNFNMGLALFPAIAGWPIMARRWPALAVLTAVATVLFLGFFSFWIVDCGNFYFAVLPLWTLLAAVATQAVIERGTGRQLAWFFVLLAADAGIFLFALSPPLTRREYDPMTLAPLWVIGFYAWLASAAWLLAVRREGPAARRTLSWTLLFAFLALGAQATAYVPRLIKASRFGGLGPVAAALLRIDPIPVNPVSLVTAYHEFGVLAQTRLPTGGLEMIGTSAAGGDHAGRPTLDRWVLETARPSRPLHLWFDSAAMAYARTHWNDGAMRGIPLDLLDFERRDSGGFTFYRVRFKDPAEGGRRWAKLDAGGPP
ncbi:MAG: hypothetical protein M1457_04140 [bacterium]|nr:hypothetical protein [bacterium]